MIKKQIIQSREAPRVMDKSRVIWENNGVFYTWNESTWTPMKDSEGPMTDEDKVKLDTVEENAQENIIETITVDGTEVTADGKTVNIDLSSKQDKLTAGENVTIENNVISAKDTTYTEATDSEAGLLSASDKAKLDALFSVLRVKDVGSFTSTALAWEACAQEALNFRTINHIYYEVAGTDGDYDKSTYATNGIVEQHYYKDISLSVFTVVQSMFTEGKTGKCYRRIINLSLDGTSIDSIGEWETIVS